MGTVTKKDLVDRIAARTAITREHVKDVVQSFLDQVIDELATGNRIEFRDFGVFEVRARKARIAQNPKTLERVQVPPRKTVKFKQGRLFRERLDGDNGHAGSGGRMPAPEPKPPGKRPRKGPSKGPSKG